MFTRQIMLGVGLTLILWEGAKGAVRWWANYETQNGGGILQSVGEATKLVAGR